MGVCHLELIASKRYFFGILNMCQKIESEVKNCLNKELMDKVFLYVSPGNRVHWASSRKLAHAINFGFVNKEGSLIPSSISKSLKEIKGIIEDNTSFKMTSLGSLKDLKSNEGVSMPITSLKDKLLELLVSKEILKKYETDLLSYEMKLKDGSGKGFSKV